MPRLLLCLLVPARNASKHAGDKAGGEALCALAFSEDLHCLRLPTCSVQRPGKDGRFPASAAAGIKEEAGRRSPPTRAAANDGSLH
ncbi:hypothetical protein BDA96_01G356400 [Sorghum bicolor]|uniref:Uncharacterized protein n=2 Tax=Sorghum bicolor TaxID=4558 RepID=A0A1Z5S8U9_SORBI|nr:hypothetical protein BDA96_01G356400 [Sorghum bicolor]OQU92370.1 hypothetical protein SORBI_3001G332933 [Sorghum bicolor]